MANNDPSRIQAYRELAQGVVLQAFEDLQSGRIEQRLSAALWLAGNDLPFWLAAAIGGDPYDMQDAGVNALSAGRKLIMRYGKQINKGV